jgi:hypothetical protein
MYRTTGATCIACFLVLLLGNVGESLAEQAGGQQKTFSGGTQGLQEKLYEERMKEFQQSQSQTSTKQPRGMQEGGGSAGPLMKGDAAVSASQGSQEGVAAGGSGQSDSSSKGKR